jgi:soluble lytic murein transglycosylase-like protein
MLPMRGKIHLRWSLLLPAMAGLGMHAYAGAPGPGRVVEHITLRNGFDLMCDHFQADGARVRLYLDAAGTNFVEVATSDIASDEQVTLPVDPDAAAAAPAPVADRLTDGELQPILEQAGAAYDIDADLLASVVRQESGGHPRAVSRAGAQGLMQLMPGTASDLGVNNSFVPSQNIQGGTAYLDALLRRYHDQLPLALAAYNAGPGAVDRWHGIPPYPETRAYVARVIHEYNRRYAQRRKAEASSAAQLLAAAH